jgi:hypothetical protein
LSIRNIKDSKMSQINQKEISHTNQLFVKSVTVDTAVIIHEKVYYCVENAIYFWPRHALGYMRVTNINEHGFEHKRFKN